MNSSKNCCSFVNGSLPGHRTAYLFPRLRFFVVLLIVLFSLIAATGPARAVDDNTAIEEGFALLLAAVSPDGGWESTSGRSAAYGAEMVFREINSSREGLHGLDVLIEKVPQPENLEEARKAISQLRARGILAVVCFASNIPASYVAQAASESGMPLILCHSETIPLGLTPQSPDPFLFGLDLEKSFRARTLSLWAETRKGTCPWAIFIDRVDPYLSIQGETTEKLLKQKGMETKTYWFVRSSVADIMGRLSESMGEGEGNPWIISWLSPIMSLRIYSTAQRNALPINLLHADIPSDLLRPHDGIFILDQNGPLRDKNLLKTLGNHLWATCGTVQSEGLHEEAVRAVAAFQWIRKALENLPGKNMDRRSLAGAIESVPDLQVETLFFPLSARTHRPAERPVSILVSKDGDWEEVERLIVSGP